MAKDRYRRRRNLWSSQIASLSRFQPHLSIFPFLNTSWGWWRGAGRWWERCSLLDWVQRSYGHKARRDGAPRCATTICPSGSQEGQPLDRVLRCFYSSRAWGVWLWPVAFLLDSSCGCTRHRWSVVSNVQRGYTEPEQTAPICLLKAFSPTWLVFKE